VLVDEFDFELPDELIAQHARRRGESRMLVLRRETAAVDHTSIADLSRYLGRGDLLVVNDTRVFAARLLGERIPSGGAVECLLIARTPGTLRTLDDSEVWDALMHPGQKLKPGAMVRFEGEQGALSGEVLERRFFGRRTIRLDLERGDSVTSVIDRIGHIPLPPYIKRGDTPEDRERYQTIYARARGSIAAPTAGLHFTPHVLEALDAAGVERIAITLHVGYGTFKPVRTEDVESHVVDPEPYQIADHAAESINRAIDEGRRIIAVGTTTTRALEDSATRGHGRVTAGWADATVFIYPGFHFQVVTGLLTNFHLPKSSLLMLVAAFAGRERVLAAYREAVAESYRFYSYGDAMLIL
jgi:S-adenosylmethionine:tRNA ribosyltransferase-isomerase